MLEYTIIDEDKNVLFDEILDLNTNNSEMETKLHELIKDREVLGLKIVFNEPQKAMGMDANVLNFKNIETFVLKLKNKL